ncbi:MAG TPA: type II toxin-antitoxin system HicB family antitoxin [Planctomycetaceae bacterium]|nr:type II toxin-antitoxin system HicB family antitoxin [Planctomycetaceae bacterium]
MLTYKAAFKLCDDGVHAEVVDFPGVITCAATVEEARRLLRSALVDMAEFTLDRGDSLPRPDETMTSADADLEEPIHLLLSAASQIERVPADVA